MNVAESDLLADAQPWHQLPARIAPVLRAALGQVTDEVIAAVRQVPAYARPLEGAFGEGVRSGVREALEHLLEEIECGCAVPRPDVYRRLGRGEMRAGRTLESLLAAYRAGARVAWRRFAAVGREAQLEPEVLYLLAESIFAYIDVLSAESVEGYALEQSSRAGETEAARRELVRVLVRRPGAAPEEVQHAAAAAGWRLPRTLAVLVTHAVTVPPAAKLRLPAEAIADRLGELMVAIVPDAEAPGRLAELREATRRAGTAAALGTCVPWQQAAVSFERARAALALADRSGGLVLAEEHLGELLLAADPALARELAHNRLAPLADLSEGSRARLQETLRAWLAHQGRLGPVAAALGVHPQTARYRLARLRERFGSALDDPDARFWLELALRAQSAAPAVGFTQAEHRPMRAARR
jgi:hypothetical protein